MQVRPLSQSGQQGWPLPPQVWQVPALAPDVPPAPGVAPPQASSDDWQPPPGQQAAPWAPQFRHIVVFPVAAQPRPVLHGVMPSQQIIPSAPHGEHVPGSWLLETLPRSQDSPPSQLVEPKQHDCPLAPHATHISFTQLVLDAVHAGVSVTVRGGIVEPPAPPAPAATGPRGSTAMVAPQQI